MPIPPMPRASSGFTHPKSWNRLYWGGIAILFAPGLDVNVLTSTELVKGWVLLVRVEIEGLDFYCTCS